MASIWKKNLGVNVKLENQEWKTFLDNRHQGTFDVARAGWCADYNEPTSFLNTMLSDSSNNTSHYKSPAFDKIIAETLKTSDDAKRATFTRNLSSSWIKTPSSYRSSIMSTPVWLNRGSVAIPAKIRWIIRIQEICTL